MMLLRVAFLMCLVGTVLAFSPNRMRKEIGGGKDALNTNTCHRYPCWPNQGGMSLDGVWEFHFDAHIDDPRDVDVTKVNFTDKMAVPGSFDASPRYAGVRGTAFYRKTVYVASNHGWRLKFEACSLWCAVYVDGKKITEHSNGYSAFWVDSADPGEHQLIVISDNRFDSNRTILQSAGYDFYQYGGIIRRVSLHEMPGPVSIAGADVITNNEDLSTVSARIRLHALSGGHLLSTYSVSYAVDLNDAPSSPQELPVKGDQITIDNIKIDFPTRWHPSNPVLHTLYLSVSADNTEVDSIIVRFGLRSVAACKRSSGEATLCINGNETKLLGFSRHDAHPQYGASLNRQQWMQDVQILKDMGGNYFRLVHYPHDPDFLALCDEMGVLVWQENLGWGNSKAQLTDPAFVKALLQGVDEMVNNTFNHPSIIIWAFLNEGASESGDACRDAYQTQAARYRELQVNGLVSWASNKKTNDVCLDHADVVSFNSYPGWYGDSSDHSLTDQLATVQPTIVEEASWVAEHQNKPFIKSEIGAGAIPEWEDLFRGFWTADYQASLLSIVAETVASNQNFTGVSLWQFFDVRTYNGPKALGRPRALNNKGLLDEYRRPKRPSFDAIRAVFQGKAKQDSCPSTLSCP